MVFEEIYPNLTTSHWLTHIPVQKCRQTNILKNNTLPMLCSGSTIGSREGIIQYIDAMVEEFDYWKIHDKCRSDMVGDDQAIHNYLFYKNKFGVLDQNDAISIPHRMGAIHVVGYQADKIFRKAIQDAFDDANKSNNYSTTTSGLPHFKDLMDAETWVNSNGFRVGTNQNHIPTSWKDRLGQPQLAKHNTNQNLVDPKTGFILNNDGITPSPQVHQFDRFGLYVQRYIDRMTNEVWN